MNEADAPMSEGETLEHLRRIQYLLGQRGRILARDSGLTEKEFLELDDEQLIEVSHFRDEGEVLDTHHIENILPKGLLILADSVLAKPGPLQVTVVTPPKSLLRRIYAGTRSGLWDLVKIAAGAVLGWVLKKYFP